MLQGESAALPSFSSALTLKNRFIEDHLVYSLSETGTYPPEPGESQKSAAVNIVPLNGQSDATELALEHSAIRLERLGEHAILTGYKNAAGLSVSHLSLEENPIISSTTVLKGRFESEGRSHAFNAVINRGKSGYLGLPTVLRPENAGRRWWNSESSDVSFLSMSSQQGLVDRGALLTSKQAEDSDYQCEVSCTDWYGNSRPIFTDKRIFALSGLELIEGQLIGGHIKERHRINLTAAPK